MAKSELGVKRIDPETGRKFYDLNKDPIVSPYTGKSYPRSFFSAGSDLSRADDEEETEVEADEEAPEIVSLEEADDEAKGDDVPDDIGDDDVDIEDDEEDTFLEEEEEDDDDVTDIVNMGEDDDEV
ncbi:MAG: TIGR02300 family protein [Rhizobiaceae bacterium]